MQYFLWFPHYLRVVFKETLLSSTNTWGIWNIMELSYFLKFSYLVTDTVKSRTPLLYTLTVIFEFFLLSWSFRTYHQNIIKTWKFPFAFSAKTIIQIIIIFHPNYALVPQLAFLLLPSPLIFNKAPQMILVRSKLGHATDLLNSFQWLPDWLK